MKTVDIDQFAANLYRYVEDSRQETIVVTRGGKPCAVLHGVAADLETAELMHSPDFWTMIEQRRREPTVPWKEAHDRLKAIKD